MSEKALSRFHQPISVPGRRLLHQIPLHFVTKKAAGGGARAVNHEIPLIPFIDFLLCIVLFLLASFSATGELPIDKNVKLPNAENVLEIHDADLADRLAAFVDEVRALYPPAPLPGESEEADERRAAARG